MKFKQHKDRKGRRRSEKGKGRGGGGAERKWGEREQEREGGSDERERNWLRSPRDLPSASWRPRRVGGAIQSEPTGLGTRENPMMETPAWGRKRCPSSAVKQSRERSHFLCPSFCSALGTG